MIKTPAPLHQETPLEECRRVLAMLKDHSCLVDRATLIRCYEFLLKPMDGPMVPGLVAARRAWHRQRGASGQSCPTDAMCESFDAGFHAAHAQPGDGGASCDPIRFSNCDSLIHPSVPGPGEG